MAHRTSLLAVTLLAMIVHAVVIARTLLPAQDGLKFIRIARQFQTEPWTSVVRDSDVHPLYPGLIAVAEPVVAWFAGRGPEAWRIAAQAVAALASVGLVVPIYYVTRSLFDRWIAFLAATIAILLPRAAELGHDTLNNSLGLLTTFLALWLGAVALRKGDWRVALVAGLVAGVGYLARPEVVLLPVAIGLTWLTGLRFGRASWGSALSRLPALALLVGMVLVVMGYYALLKGEISEKLAVRYGAWLGPQRILHRAVPQQAPRGLDDPRWDFTPKEESEQIPIRNWRSAVVRIAGKWWEELCWFFAVMTVWGLVRYRFVRSLCPDRDERDTGEMERRSLIIFATVYGLALLRHCTALGYLSGRHIMVLVMASVPWAAAGTYVCGRGLAVHLRLSPRLARIAAGCVLGVAIAGSIVVQMRPTHLNHLSRWGHWAAGQWLATHARPTELVLDTRGWARFISGRPGYDYWHVRQALTDSHLNYIIVGLDELVAPSPRADTLKALLTYAATPLADFPAFPGDQAAGVRLYRFHRPDSWEGLAR
jgi:hypothetical protein